MGPIGDFDKRQRAGFTGKIFDRPADYRGRTFEDDAHFTDVEFQQDADFRGAIFTEGAVFSGCRFRGPVSFAGATFLSTAYFWAVEFQDEADFSNISVAPLDDSSLPGTGEANFSWARFHARSNFAHAQFKGPAFFWGTIFRSPVSFARARFERDASFYGGRNAVLVSRGDFGGDNKLWASLLREGILRSDVERPDGANATFNDFASLKDLGAALRYGACDEDSVRLVEAFWSRYPVGMFSGDVGGADFTDAILLQPDNIRFWSVDMSRSLLSGSNVGQCEFIDVKWDRRIRLLLGGRRNSVHDERFAGVGPAYAAVGRIYHDLNKTYENHSDADTAGDFRYGSIEMRRRVQPGWLRHVSLTAWYGYLCGYGQNYTLAVFWLVCSVAVLFPALYFVLGFSADPRRAVLHSLETATFLNESDKNGVLSVPIRFTQACERMIIPIIIGLLLPTVRRRFTRETGLKDI